METQRVNGRKLSPANAKNGVFALKTLTMDQIVSTWATISVFAPRTPFLR